MLFLKQTKHHLRSRPRALWREASWRPGAADLPPPHGQGPALRLCPQMPLDSMAKHLPHPSCLPQDCELGGRTGRPASVPHMDQCRAVTEHTQNK